MPRVVILTVVILLTVWLTPNSHAGWTSEVTQAPAFDPSTIARIAVFPFSCGSGVNCLWIERRLIQVLESISSAEVLGPSELRREMIGRNLSSVDDETVRIVATSVSADVILLVEVGSPDYASGEVSLSLRDLESGQLLMFGTGEGEVRANYKELAFLVLKQMLKKGFKGNRSR